MIDIQQEWPYLFSGIVGVTVVTLTTWLFYIRDQHHRNIELIASSFPNIINFSFNFMEDGTLKFRTLFETTIEDIAQSPELERIMQIAANNCTEEDAFFAQKEGVQDTSKTLFGRLQQKVWPELNWTQASQHIHTGILNALSMWYSEGHFGHALLGIIDPHTGRPKHQNICTVTETFCFGLTCEKNPDVRVQKIRVMIAAKDFLQYQVDKNAPPPQFERPGHWVRWETMCQMKRHLERQEEAAAQNKTVSRKVWELNLSFIMPKMSRQAVEEEMQMASHFENLNEDVKILCEQIQSSDALLKLRPSMGPRGSVSSDSGPGSESADDQQTDRSTLGDLAPLQGSVNSVTGTSFQTGSDLTDEDNTSMPSHRPSSKERRLSGQSGSLNHSGSSSFASTSQNNYRNHMTSKLREGSDRKFRILAGLL